MEYNFCCVLCPVIGLLLLLSSASAQTPTPDEIDAAGTTTTTPASPSTPKLLLAIHYEALCPDSMYFIRRRLYDALVDNDWWARTELKLYPFGKASVSKHMYIDNNLYDLICLIVFLSSTTTLKSESCKCSVNIKSQSAN